MRLITLALVVSVVIGQQVGTNTAENHPQLPSSVCTKSGGCQQQDTSVVLDSNWRWLHTTSGYTNCYTGNKWNPSICPDPVTCAQNCAVDGADYKGTYGVTTSGSTLQLDFVTQGPYSKNIGSRLYLMANESQYEMFYLKNREFTFDVDVSQLPCGLNGAVYFVSMDPDGGLQYPTNKAGAKYGTGYCDAQCPRDMKFIDGQANMLNWTPDSNNPNAGTGFYGTCCTEMDIWEANSFATALTPHVCSVQGGYRCNGTDCGDGNQRQNGVCDKDGCDFNSFRMGNDQFFGSGMTVDTTQPVTVVTQFITDNGQDNGNLVEIRRIYKQNGKVIQNSNTNVPGMKTYNSISEQYCSDQKQAFGDVNGFGARGGLKELGKQMEAGMVLVLSLWDDYDVYMLWLDSDYPTDQPPSKPGIARGPCPTSSGRPWDVESQHANANVKYMNIKLGELNSTY